METGCRMGGWAISLGNTSCRHRSRLNDKQCTFGRWLLLVFICCATLFSTVVEADMTFTTTNVAEASMHSTMQLFLSSNWLIGDPAITNDDSIFFIEDSGTDPPVCPANVEQQALYPVSQAVVGGFSGYVQVTVTSKVFSVGKRYIACYVVKNSANESTPMRRKQGSSVNLLVWPAVYASAVYVPANPYGGQGPVDVTAQQVEQAERPNNYGLTLGFSVFMPPCTSAAQCADLDTLATQCGIVQSSANGSIVLTDIRGEGTTQVRGKLVVPYTPNPEGYYMCVPYCHLMNGNCGTNPVSISYALVASTPVVHKFPPANPGIYTRTPAQPQARELGTMTFTGTGLSETDAVKVIRSDQDCTNPSASLLRNLRVGKLASESNTTTTVTFIAPELVTEPLVGRVCYYRNDTKLWAPVYLNAVQPEADFTVHVLQPTGFNVESGAPTVGQAIVIDFIGTGIDIGKDRAYLIDSTIPNPCDDPSTDSKFDCIATGTLQCTAVVDPPHNGPLSLVVCYQKDGRANFAQVNGTVQMQVRNPTFTLALSRIYAGQLATLRVAGTGLSTGDLAKVVGAEEDCQTASPHASVTWSFVSEMTPGASYNYSLIGAGNLCLKVCYQFAGESNWVVSREAGGDGTGNDGCPAQNLYISYYPLRYQLPVADVRALETTTLRFTSAEGQVVNGPVSVRVVRSPNECVLKPCGDTAVCEQTTHLEDFVGSVANRVAVVQLRAINTTYIVCVQPKDGVSLIPVLPSNSTTPSSTEYGFTVESPNPVFDSKKPDIWRVAMGQMTSTFSGNALKSTTDVVYPVATDTLLSDTSKAVWVCPTPGSRPPTILTSTIIGSESTEVKTVAMYTGAYGLSANDVVHLCYEWSSESTRRMSYVTSITLEESVPSKMTVSEAPSDGFRAGDAVLITFTSGAVALSADTDAVYFYRYAASAGANPRCYCEPVSCRGGELVGPLDSATLKPGTTDQETIFDNPRGFHHYSASSIYVVCYTKGNVGSDTFMGTLAVGAANPTQYVVTSEAGSAMRVGTPLYVKAERRCLEASCSALAVEDSMVILPSDKTCNMITSPEASPNVQPIGSPTVQTGGLSYTQAFVVDAVGTYRVCYKVAGRASLYTELPHKSGGINDLINVIEADPLQFTSIPASPSAGQFITILLSCSTDLCKSCTAVRIVKGARASCWNSSADSHTSDNCPTTTSVQFPNEFLEAGEYTICYGSTISKSRRVPGIFTVAPANPSVFRPMDDARTIYTNQDLDYVLTVAGVELGVRDSIFLMTTKGFTCHDLHQNAFNTNSTLAQWFDPSVNPNPLKLTATGVSWVASGHRRRFGNGIIDDNFLCDNPGVSCTMQLCYKRDGETWAPVPIEEGAPLVLKPSNPRSVHFDRYPLAHGLYTMVTVSGSALLATDTLRLHEDRCSGGELSTTVGTATINSNSTQWIGVIRITGISANAYAVCYWSGTAATEIVALIFPPPYAEETPITIVDPLYYTYAPTNYSSSFVPISRYEEVMVSGTFVKTGSSVTGITSVEIIDANPAVAECNYEPYFTATGNTDRFPVVETLVPIDALANYYEGRLTAPLGEYVFCMMSTIGLFRTVSPAPEAPRKIATLITLRDANPVTYQVVPAEPMPNQTVQLAFTQGSGEAGSVTALEENDFVQIITGTLYECGFRNSSIVAEGLVTSVETGSTGSPTALASLTLHSPFNSSLTEASLTVCYRRKTGTFSTVPRDGLVDRNLRVLPQIPLRWSISPQQAQQDRPLTVTFYGTETEKEFLSPEDTAFLIAVDTANGPIKSSVCQDGTPSVEGGTIVISGDNSLWTIPEGTLKEGTYAVCYTAKKNGQAVYVRDKEYLTVFPLQSPTGAYSLRGGLDVYQGERFYLLFNSTVALSPVLMHSTTDALPTEADGVVLSANPTCAAPLAASNVTAIPTEFGYKPLSVTDPTTSLPVPYLHLRIRADPGNYYICMKRHARESWEAFFTYEVIGGPQAPVALVVTVAPITQFTTTPEMPRVAVPGTTVTPILGGMHSIRDLTLLFFVPFNAQSSNTEDQIKEDNCYRPQSRDEAISDTTPLVNTSLRVSLETLRTVVPFDRAVPHLLCYQMENLGIASVFPHLLSVKAMSPNRYEVPSIIAVGGSFSMGIYSTDSIFSPSNANRANIYTANEDLETVPSCDNGALPAEGTTSFTTFTIVSSTYATVTPTILKSGYYYLCFLTYDQVNYAPIPNAGGGYVFSVGLTGAQRYYVVPAQAYAGQELEITISGSLLSNKDRVKVVNVTSVAVGDYSKACTEVAANADAAESNGADGSVVISTGGITALYNPRLITAGTFVLCYKSDPLGATWQYVSNIPFFTVGDAHPTSYALIPSPSYETEVSRLYIRDEQGVGLLQSTDSLKLVTRGTGARGFDCTQKAAPSEAVGQLKHIPQMSNSKEQVYNVCGTTATSVTVCYKLADGTWAEVPRISSTPPYTYDPIQWLPNPFSGPNLALVREPVPYQIFEVFFTSSNTAVEVTSLSFALAPVAPCSETIDYVEPLDNVKVGGDSKSRFRVALPASGTYVVFLGTRDGVDMPKIMHDSTLTIGLCDPCELSPPYASLGSTATVSFPSRPGGTLSINDAMRLIPVKQGLSGDPCNNPTGPFAEQTHKPTSIENNGDRAYFNVTAGTVAEASKFLGDYHVCYRKNADDATSVYAILSNTVNEPLVFSIYPIEVAKVSYCPSDVVYAQQRVIYNITPMEPKERVAFSAMDEFVLIPQTDATPAVACEGLSLTTTRHQNDYTPVHTLDALLANNEIELADGRVHATLEDFTDRGSNWYLTLPRISSSTASYFLCFRLRYASRFQALAPTSQVVRQQDPMQLVTVPAVILPTTPSPAIVLLGNELLPGDDVYVVPPTESCAESCVRRLNPAQWTDVPYVKYYVDPRTVTLNFSSALEKTMQLRVCYRRSGSLLVTVGQVRVGEPNPSSYTTDFVPREGTRPLFTFVGQGLGATDRFMIAPLGEYCLEESAVARGTFVGLEGTSSSFTLSLDRVPRGRYAVCYEDGTMVGFTDLPTVLEVLPGGPDKWSTSNTPMRWRATVITFASTSYTPRKGDAAYIACPTCSCFDTPSYASVAYGTPSQEMPNDDSPPIALRVGFNDTNRYPVCYKVADSGYAQVGSSTSFLGPVTNSPASVTVYPSPTYQGQRLSYNFTSYTASVPVADGDSGMLVRESRYCWENEKADSSLIIAQPSQLLSVGPGAVWGLLPSHVPSLGPDALDSSAFPIQYLVCYREANQEEFVVVPYPVRPFTVNGADPATYTTAPANPEMGMVGVSLVFPGAEVGDRVYVVRFVNLTNTVCTDTDSVALAPAQDATSPIMMNIPWEATPYGDTVAVCYTKAGATVAEVPQRMTIAAGNPSRYETNLPASQAPRERQYIQFSFIGVGLSIESDKVIFADEPCNAAGAPGQSSLNVARVSDLTVSADATIATVTVQFIAAESPIPVYPCYRHNDIWRRVGGPVILEAPKPSTVSMYPHGGSKVPRAGQYINLYLNGIADNTAVVEAAVISASNSDPGSWCHNFTVGDVREPLLKIELPLLLGVPVWQHAGPARLCVRLGDQSPWSDLSTLSVNGTAGDLVIHEPSTSYLEPYPLPPRVGQEVTLSFHLIVEVSERDLIRITAMDGNPCHNAVPLPGYPEQISVTVVNSTATKVVVRDETDPHVYRSFAAVGAYRVCYLSAAEGEWAVVGGTNERGVVTVEEQVPQSWQVVSGDLQVGRPFVLQFNDSLGLLNPSADIAWAAPSTQSCGVDPYNCKTCVVFQLDTVLSTPSVVLTKPAASLIVDGMSICYTLAGATASQLPNPLTIKNNEVECVTNSTVRVGAPQVVVFRIRQDTVVAADSWRVSFYVSPTGNCSDNYAPSFPEGRAKQIGSTATSVMYAVEWPVSLIDERYTICYRHNGQVGPVCTCEQIDTLTGDCFITTLESPIENFAPSVQPVYVGQTITIAFAVRPSQTQFFPKSVKFVKYVDSLTTCSENAAFTTSGTWAKLSDVRYHYTFKHDYKLQPDRLLVCVQTDMSEDFIRVALAGPPASDHLLSIRPYLTLTTFPVKSEYLREMQFINFTFTHESKNVDDVVQVGDQMYFAPTPENCVEAYIDANPITETTTPFMLTDTAFTTMPASVTSIEETMRRADTYATFKVTAKATYTVCYKLAKGHTWAPVLPSLSVLEAASASCEYAKPASPSNSDKTDYRAMQYIVTTITGSQVFAGLYKAEDAIRVIPQQSPCTDDAAAVFMIGTSVRSTGNDGIVVGTITFSPVEGPFKLCYRFGGSESTVSNWSPMCSGVEITPATPLGAMKGCLNQGQAIDINATQLADFQFTAKDSFRYVAGEDPCIFPNLTSSVLLSVQAGGEVQTVAGVSPAADNDKTVTVPYALLGTGTTSFRLCYVDAAGNQFAVPLTSSKGTSVYPVQPRQPAELVVQRHVQNGLRVLLNFTSAGPEVTPALTPYDTVPYPFIPGPPSDGTFDGAGALSFSANATYREGYCTATVRAGGVINLSGVYGSPAQTTGYFDPTSEPFAVICYYLASCGVTDVGYPIPILSANPASAEPQPPAPRRGQLINITFFRSFAEAGALPLTPGADRGAYVPYLESCWTLGIEAGQTVVGTAERTQIQTIIHAEPPEVARDASVQACYFLTGLSWGAVPLSNKVILSANPAYFSTQPASARRYQMIQMVFHGSGLGRSDRVKIISLSNECTDDSVPPAGIVAYDTVAGEAIVGTSDGWVVASAVQNGLSSQLKLSSSLMGDFSVCYRLATDIVWTLVYGSLHVKERDPAEMTQTPISALEGELFTLDFTSTGDSATSSLTHNDKVVLYKGADVDCFYPHTGDQIIVSPSRSDQLPHNISFQMDAGTRGSYTVCYKNIIADGTVPIGGFPSIIIGDNPKAVAWFPTSVNGLRVQELAALVFSGFGLVATPEKSDKVKLISSTFPRSDKSCWDVESAGGVVYRPLYANGTHAVQILHARTTPGTYWICYRLHGGQFHVIGEEFGITQPAVPTGVTSNKPAEAVLPGESVAWVFTGVRGCSPDDIVYYSDRGCEDAPYVVAAAGFTDELYSWGAAAVSCRETTATTTVVVNWKLGAPMDKLSLCYYLAADNSVSVVKWEAITVPPGVPPPITTPIPAVAQEIFAFAMEVTSAQDDYVVLVTDLSSCSGKEAPPDSAVFLKTEYNAASSTLTVTAAVPHAGVFYICYAHRVDECAPGTGRDCARIVGEVQASPNGPVSWTGSPLTVYTTETTSIQIHFGESGAPTVKDVAWLALLRTLSPAKVERGTRAIHTMQDVADACLAPRDAADRIPLRYDSVNGMWSNQVNAPGTYALCYLVDDGKHLPSIFPPASKAGPVVFPSTVDEIVVSGQPGVGATLTIVLMGGGLSQGDTVTAIRLSSGTGAIPPDICTNTDASARLKGDIITTGTGLRALDVRFLFPQTGQYVLCYLAVWRPSGSQSQLISKNSFVVSPSGLDMEVVSPVQLVGLKLELAFMGVDLSSEDVAAMVPVAESSTGTSIDVKVCDKASFTRVTSASTDGTRSSWSTVPGESGKHVICYKVAGAVVLVPRPITIGVRTAVSAKFIELPKCQARFPCVVQPILGLFDKAGSLTADIGATVKMHLYFAANGASADHLIIGAELYIHTDYATFTFLGLRVSTEGEYVMEANVELPGGAILSARSPAFKVEANDAPLPPAARVVCIPSDIIARDDPTTSTTIDCSVTVLTPIAPDDVEVKLEGGGSMTTPVQNGTTAAGLPIYQFTVTPPFETPTAKYIKVAVQFNGLHSSWPVANSPVIVRIADTPQAVSVLQCSQSKGSDLPASDMIRAGERLQCTIQSRRMVNGVAVDIPAVSRDLRTQLEYNGDPVSRIVVDIGEFAIDVNGRYVFEVPIRSALSASVIAEVPASIESSIWTGMINSPRHYTIISVPAEGDSSLACTSQQTNSRRWFTAAERLLCQVHLADRQGPINGIWKDFKISAPDGGVYEPLFSNLWGTTLPFNLTAPSVPGRLAAQRAYSEVINNPKADFRVQVQYIPTSTIIATHQGTLVYVTAVKTPSNLIPGGQETFVLTGSGLLVAHHYSIGSTAFCNQQAPTAEAHTTTVEGELALTLTIPTTPFYLCFAPEDAGGRPTLLVDRMFKPGGDTPSSGWTRDDLVLLIVGLVFLTILFVLFLVLLWRAFCAGARRTEHRKEEVYMPPRVNDRFVYRGGPLGVSQTPQPPLSAPHVEQPLQHTSMPQTASNRLTVNIHDDTKATYAANRSSTQNPTGPVSSSSDATSCHPPAAPSKQHQLDRGSGTRANGDPPSSAASGSVRRRRKHRKRNSRYADVDATPSDTDMSTPYSRDLLHRGKPQPPSRAASSPPLGLRNIQNLPPLPPAPGGSGVANPMHVPPLNTPSIFTEQQPPQSMATAPSSPSWPMSGPYQHLHHAGPQSSPAVPQAFPNESSLQRTCGSEQAEPHPGTRGVPVEPQETEGEKVGPFVVVGHTSKPMVSRSNSAPPRYE